MIKRLGREGPAVGGVFWVDGGVVAREVDVGWCGVEGLGDLLVLAGLWAVGEFDVALPDGLARDEGWVAELEEFVQVRFG